MTRPIDRLPAPAAVLFDLDGTLVDTVTTRIDAWELTFTEVGLPIGRDRLSPLIGLDGRRLAREVAALHGDRIDDERAEAIDRRSGEIYAGLNTAPTRLPGVDHVVAALEHGATAGSAVDAAALIRGGAAAVVETLDEVADAIASR